MEDLKLLAKAAKQRLKNNFWADCKKSVEDGKKSARERGISEMKVKSSLFVQVKKEVRGEREDEFYLKVKKLLDEEGEVSDAIGRLTDKQHYATLTYDEKQRYNLELSAKYLAALERYRKEKEYKI